MLKTRRMAVIFIWISTVTVLSACSSMVSFCKPPNRFTHSGPCDTSLWQNMGNDFVIDCDSQNPSVQKQIKWFQSHPKHLHQILKNSEPFIHYVYQKTHENNLPAELALIPLIESQYNPASGAKSGAAGLWQMMPSTATKFGIKINHAYDGRKDVTASTRAALNYLSYLYKYFNRDWLLALAAYDAGEGKIKSASRKKNSFWKLSLAKETKIYVPKLLAIATIIKNPAKYKITLPKISKDPYLQEMHIKNHVDVNEVAKSTGTDIDTLRHFNPGIRKDVVSLEHPVTLLIPSNSTTLPNTDYSEEPILKLTSDYSIETETSNTISKNSENENTLTKPETTHDLSSTTNKKHRNKSYTIKDGDSLIKISEKFHVSVKKLRSTNHISHTKLLKAGKKIIIPLS